MSLIRDIIVWILLRCWKLVFCLAIAFVALFLFYAIKDYWVDVNEKANRLRAEISRLEEQSRHQFSLREQHRLALEELNRRKPWPLDPRMIFWSREYGVKNDAYFAAGKLGAECKKKAEDTSARLEVFLRDGEGRWLFIAEDVRNKLLPCILPLAVAVFCLPGLWKAFWFFIVAPCTSRAENLVILPGAPHTRALAHDPARIQEITLTELEPLCTAPGWVNKYPADGVEKRTRLLWNMKAPLISYAAGLRELTEWRAAKGKPAGIQMCSGEDPNQKILKVDLAGHPGLVVKPSHIIALSGDVNVMTRWTFSSLHSWMSGRFRHIIFHGDGSLYLKGYGDVDGKAHTRALRMSDKLLVAFDPACSFKTVRTETFWPFLRGKAPLYDFEFESAGLIVCQSAQSPKVSAQQPPFTSRVEGWADLLLKPFGF